MSKRLPIVPTLIVAAAVLLMARLGVWQLHRLHEKETLVARYAENLARPPVPFQALWPVKEEALYRRVTATCPGVVRWKAEAGRSAAGEPGWRHIALCGTGAEGPGLAVDVGTSRTAATPNWAGGPVRGRLTWAPTGQPLVARLFGAPPPSSPMVVSETPARGLAPTAQPDPSAIPNNHLSYAVQWFFFAATAVVIYLLALRRRGRSVAPPDPPR